MPNASEFRRRAREALTGNWPAAIAVTFVAWLLGGVRANIELPEFIYETDLFNNDIVGPWVILWSKGIIPTLMQHIQPLLLLYGFWLLLFSLLFFLVIGGVAEIGICRYHTLLVAGREQRPFATLFQPFHYVGRAVALRILTTLFIALWALLFIIPGIIATYRYALAPYILAHEPEMGAMEAIQRSKELMKGHKFRLFCLHLSFIGWLLLSSLTLGLAGLAVWPYMCAAQAAFYVDVAQPFNNGE